ncbi:O-antigen polymerase [Priestia aryabhattai]|uniref:O-antigen polymerase n=1 Tax=Priestia aryabhattai TaxID=412384 RepID=UPI0020D26C33|nr:O-antigen polymerase [Priestia aryabhattai]
MFSLKVYKFIINPVSLYSTLWMVFAFLACQGIWDLYYPSLEAILYILISTAVFTFTSFLTYAKFRKNSSDFKKVDSSNLLSKNRFVLLIVLNILSIVCVMPFLLQTAPLLINGEWALVRTYYLNANTMGIIFNTHKSLMLQWIIFPTFYVTTIISAVLVAKRKPSLLLIFISTVGILMIVFTTAGRSPLLKCLTFYLLAFLINSKNIKNILRKIKQSNLAIKILLICGVIALLFISSQRSLSEDTSPLQNAFYYFTAPIVYFSYIVENPEQFALDKDYLFGKATLGFISTPIEIIYSILLKHDYVGADTIITGYVSQYINFSPSIKGNAVSTSLYPFIKDFGKLGVVIGPLIYAFLVNYVYAKFDKNIFWNCLSIYMLYTVFFSEWQYELLFPQAFSMIFFLYILVGIKSIPFKKNKKVEFLG